MLRGLFSQYSIPEQCVDNGPQFVSSDSKTFLKANSGINIRSAPYHPETNGLAEWFVQTMKQAQKSTKGSTTIHQKLDNVLQVYLNTPHATSNESPAMLLFKLKIRTRLDLLKPDMSPQVMQNQESQVSCRQSDRQFHAG